MIGLFEFASSQAPGRRRDRSREQAGKSERSYIKHGLIRRAVSGQAAAYRAKHAGRILLIDGNAGDGIGVEETQLDFFDANLSRPTPEILCTLAAKLGDADVLLCEKSADKRASLQERFPTALIIGDHAGAIDFVRPDHRYALWVSDPCGPRDHGIEHMHAVAARLPQADFVVAFNEGWISTRCIGTKSAHWAKHREKYPPMVEPRWWLDHLERRHMARTPIINGAANFKYRVLVVSNFLTDAVKRRPFEVIS